MRSEMTDHRRWATSIAEPGQAEFEFIVLIKHSPTWQEVAPFHAHTRTVLQETGEKITHPKSHTSLSGTKCVLWTFPPVRCRWVKYYIKASLMFHRTSHISPQYQVQN